MTYWLTILPCIRVPSITSVRIGAPIPTLLPVSALMLLPIAALRLLPIPALLLLLIRIAAHHIRVPVVVTHAAGYCAHSTRLHFSSVTR